MSVGTGSFFFYGHCPCRDYHTLSIHNRFGQAWLLLVTMLVGVLVPPLGSAAAAVVRGCWWSWRSFSWRCGCGNGRGDSGSCSRKGSCIRSSATLRLLELNNYLQLGFETACNWVNHIGPVKGKFKSAAFQRLMIKRLKVSLKRQRSSR